MCPYGCTGYIGLTLYTYMMGVSGLEAGYSEMVVHTQFSMGFGLFQLELRIRES